MAALTPGQEYGQAGPAGMSWSDYVDGLVAERGSLAAAALHLAEQRGFTEDLASVERGLRRLRERGSKDGGVWGQRALRCFGLPAAVTERIRWMGQYHTRFTDLPASLGEELLRPWDRPPVSESPARIWLLLGWASLALRRQQREAAATLLDQAALLVRQAEPAAELELLLARAYLDSRPDPDVVIAALERAGVVLREARVSLGEYDHACLFARWIDQRAYPLNKPPAGRRPDHRGAIALYEQIPASGPAFARCRRHNGLGWTWLRLGEPARALEQARSSVEAAGDSGSLRMRAMALNLLAAAAEPVDPSEAERARARARAIAEQLEDETLRARFGTGG